MSAPLVALDDFAGTGWGVACQRLGIEERGVEIMPEARATRAANGMTTVGADIWEHLAETAETPLAYDLLISSPPCQTFSMAGSGAGRRALDEVVALIDSKAYTDVEALRAFGEEHDPRTALVLTPLVRVYRDAPTYVVLEQVPPVLPIWERMATELRAWGYSVVTGVLNAEQYGVPQTRRRAVLIARADGIEARMPTPTHSRYYSRDPKRLDPDVLPWVSMAEALGWGMTERPFVTAGNAVGRAEGIGGSGGKAAVNREKERGAWLRPSFTVTGGGTATGGAEVFGRRAREVMETWRDLPLVPPARVNADDEPVESSAFRQVSNYSTSGSKSAEVEGNARPRAVVSTGNNSYDIGPGAERERIKGTPEWREVSHAYERPITAPSPTLDAKVGSAWKIHAPGERGGRLVAPTTASGTRSAPWQHGETGEPINLDPERPATTVQGDPRLTAHEHHYHGEQAKTPTRVTVTEAAALQSYPPGFDWETGPNGKPLTKTKAFLQIGNAVPPLLAEAILRTIVEGEQ